MMKPRLLIADDDQEIQSQLKWALAPEFDLVVAGDAAAAVERCRQDPCAAALVDLGLPPHPNEPTEGLRLISELLRLDQSLKIIVISGQGEKENAIQAVGSGAYDFLCKPVDLDELKLILRRCLHLRELELAYAEMQKQAASDPFESMLGTSPQMQQVFSVIRKVAATDAPVLLLGESGTGKEMAAMAIHRRSAVHERPFIPINCNAIPENLLESELFGHEKGAFTGAHMQRKGLIENAAGGTLFLDEIGELPANIQVKLLRFLQEQRFQRVGGRQEIQISTRVIAATNVDLKQSVAQGRFREDLFFRIAVVVLPLPPLRERENDAELLARIFLQQFAAQSQRKGLCFSADASRALKRHTWPGNVREMQNRVKRAVIMAEGKRVTAADLELEHLEQVAGGTLRQARENVERTLMLSALRRHAGRITAAASDLGISRPTFYELMDKLGIPRKEAAEQEAESPVVS